MRKYLLGTALVAALTGCTADWDPARQPQGSSTAAEAEAAKFHLPRDPAHSFASLPDQGALFAYDRERKKRTAGAYTSHPVKISEAHAFNAIAKGEMVLPGPDGQPIRLGYSSHEEHPDGSWSWVGEDEAGNSSVLTFGEDAVFGRIASGGEVFNVRTNASGAWLVQTDSSKLAGLGGQPSAADADFLAAPGDANISGLLDSAIASASPSMSAADATIAPKAAATVVVDLVLGYTNGLVTQAGSQSAALTQLSNLVATANQAYVNSGISYRLRLVQAVLVNYPDNNANQDTLRKLTGYNEETKQAIPVDAAFTALRAARDQYGGDLVSLVRPHRSPEQNGCGIAWLLGASGSTITNAKDAAFGYSVVSVGVDLDESDSKNYLCSDDTLAHELGHNMGQVHNQENATTAGAHGYSYGYREASTSGFHTIMAYPLASSSQTSVLNFANPSVSVGGRPTGVANVSDNARSMNQTMPLVAGFRATVVPVGGKVDLYVIKKDGTSSTEIHALNRDGDYANFSKHIATGLHRTPSDESWVFLFGDYNLDGVMDLYAINKTGSSGRTEVHVLDGATGFQGFLLHKATVLGATGSNNAWQFLLGDYNRDGRPDLYAITRNGGSGRVEVHVMNGADSFDTYLLHAASALGARAVGYATAFDLADFNGDGSPDLYFFDKNGGSGTTEVHVLNGSDAFSTFLLHSTTGLGPTGSSNDWQFQVGDVNLDGVLDIYAIKRAGSSGTTEVHVLSGSDGFRSFLMHAASGLHQTGVDQGWSFMLVPQ